MTAQRLRKKNVSTQVPIPRERGAVIEDLTELEKLKFVKFRDEIKSELKGGDTIHSPKTLNVIRNAFCDDQDSASLHLRCVSWFGRALQSAKN